MRSRRAQWQALTAHAVVLAALGVVLVHASFACNPDGRPCAPGDFIACTATDGNPGAAACADDGSGYGACDENALLDASALYIDAPASSSDGGDEAEAGGSCSSATGRPITCSCTDNSQCADGDCFPFNAKGPHCTKPCTKDSDCQPLSPGCNMMGVCKSS